MRSKELEFERMIKEKMAVEAAFVKEKTSNKALTEEFENY